MCAINGFTFRNLELIHAMNRVSRHRGPDATATWLSDTISLGHNRLKIVDLDDRANQPMQTYDGRYTIVFNGEIYNYREIRSQLQYPFRTESDTEVLLAAFQEWGESAFMKFNGMFAFAIWDDVSGALTLARDMAGMKPLYYALLNVRGKTELVFASEMKSILCHDIDRRINTTTLNEYFSLLYVPLPMTLLQSVQRLPPGHCAYFAQHTLTIRPFTVEHKTEEIAVKASQAREILGAAVRRHLIGDRPIGVFLSGGMDSSIILSEAIKTFPKIHTFSTAFALDAKEEPEKFNADAMLAKKTAIFFGTTHHEIVVSKNDVPRLFEECIWHADEPIANPTMVSMFSLAAHAKKHVTVALSGEGGDEVFGGYDRYRKSLQMQYLHFLPNILAHIPGKYGRIIAQKNPVDRYLMFTLQNNPDIAHLLKTPYYHKNAAKHFLTERYLRTISVPFEKQFMDIDRETWLIDEALARSDRMSMAHGLEMRVPFLDNEVVAFGRALPIYQLMNMRRGKILLREAYRNILPQGLTEQPKRGWFAPSAKWLRDPHIGAWVNEILNEHYYQATASAFHWKYVRNLLDEHIHKKGYHRNIIWAMLAFQLWAKKYNAQFE